ncbi:MAG: thioredoxin [Bifidobacteriaceae bacterium]|jgi:thioredoxin 1|nr:thioredoxin [Bifidobacteriaceae bacterium]
MSELPEVTDANFDEKVLKSDLPVLVDFWAPWCGPCRQVGPIVEQLADAHSAKLKFMKMNIDENPTTPQRYGIASIPTLNVYKGGELVASVVGAKPKPALEADLAAYL